MRHTSETFLLGAMSLFALTGAVAMAFWDEDAGSAHVTTTRAMTFTHEAFEPETFEPEGLVGAAAWFRSVRKHCNPVEVQTALRQTPPPSTAEGDIHAAACYALAGQVDQARTLIDGLPEQAHLHAAAVVYGAGQRSAQAGDPLAAGPLMELVVEFWPDHSRALYYAATARLAAGDRQAAERYLERFFEAHPTHDAWHARATELLEEARG